MTQDKAFPPLIQHKHPDESLKPLASFRELLKSKKATPPKPGLNWYPYDTLSNWSILHSLWGTDFIRVQHALQRRPIVDVGCADGDLAFFLSYLGCEVTVVDHPLYNFNGMAGVREMAQRLFSSVRILEHDLDSEAEFALPQDDYGLVLFLGILYHLKNPFLALERLARRARFCVLSTRIAAFTPQGHPMTDEALAYLLASREANSDSTNFWIFSETGLLRLLQRASWEVRAYAKHGSAASNPSDNDRDERMYLVLRSRLRSAPATLKLTSGWWPEEQQGWCWVDKHFTIEILLLEADPKPEFELGFIVYDPAPSDKPLEVILKCHVGGVALGMKAYTEAGEHHYRGLLPESVDKTKTIILNFEVTHQICYKNDCRDLGIIIPCRGHILGTNSPISFWVT